MIVLGVSSFWTLWHKEREAHYLQKLLLAFPVLKTLHTLIITANVSLCNDQETWETANRYLIMGLISFETLFQTILLTMFFIIARGWGIVREFITRKEATYVTVSLGIVYLNYSAFFVTIELNTMNIIIRVSSINMTFST